MVASRDITVLRDGSEVVRQSLELRKLPNGAPGAKWGGLVFPLRDGDSIDVMDPGIPPGQCGPSNESSPRWRMSAGPSGAGAYLFIEGSAQTCSSTVSLLAGAGIRVLRTGPNLSGSPGDWFIRLDDPTDEDVKRIETLLADAAPISTADDETNLRERLLLQALAGAREAQARLRADLDQVRNAAIAPPARTDEETALRRNLDEISARLAEAEAEAERLRARMEAAPRPPPKPNRLETELAAAVASLLPRIDFIGNSMNFISVELPSRVILWKALAALDRQDRGQPQGWKSLSGHPGWWERHFSTGQDNQGRLYARLGGQPARWQVLVSHKQDQDEDLRRIGRM